MIDFIIQLGFFAALCAAAALTMMFVGVIAGILTVVITVLARFIKILAVEAWHEIKYFHWSSFLFDEEGWRYLVMLVVGGLVLTAIYFSFQ